MEDIKSKIKKLIALSRDNASDHESYVALQMAQRLMAKYKIEQRDIEEEEDKKCVQKKTSYSYGSRSSDHYLNELATIIAENFCCVNYIGRAPGTRTQNIYFMGMEDDVAIAEEALGLANYAIIRGYNKVYRDFCKTYSMDYMPAKYFNPAKLGFIEGYIDGLKAVFDSQKEANQEWGLVIVAPQEAKDYINNLRHISNDNVIRVDRSYYPEGYKEGSSFHMDKKIGEGNQGYITNHDNERDNP